MGKNSGLPPKSVSYWIESTPKTLYPPLQTNLHVDVVVVGGGIAGITAAYLLKREGKTVALLESGRIVQGVTGYTTAKITSQHHLIYHRLQSSFGKEAAQLYGEANEAGLDLISSLIAKHKIDCDFRRKTSYVYGSTEAELREIQKEAVVAAKLGLPARFVTRVDLPFATTGAVAFSHQAEFHPRKYLLALASKISGNGSHLFEETAVLGVRDGNPCAIKTKRATLSADHVILATHFPFPDTAFYFTRMAPKRSYALGFRSGNRAPNGMFINAGSPTRSIRAQSITEGELIILVGEGHKTGQGGSEMERYRRLEEFARRYFNVTSIDYRWSTQDNIPHDGLPYIGKASHSSKHIYVATGFQSWGMTNGTAAAMILCDLIVNRKNSWSVLFDPQRINPLTSAKKFIKENVNAVSCLIGDRLKHRIREDPKKLLPGEGAILRVNGKDRAYYKNEKGKIYQVSPVCTHIGCTVRFNDAEKTWDCPCHGSRFNYDGKVIHGPAATDLKSYKN